jgi:hypothetical protein
VNNEILKHYFTDQQMAVVLGITLGGLRNKIYRKRTADLPNSTSFLGRWRLWQKEEVHAWLLARFNNDHEMVKAMMKNGEDADNGTGKRRGRRKR